MKRIFQITLLSSIMSVSFFCVSAQRSLLEAHYAWENLIQEHFPGEGKKNSDGSYTLHINVAGSELGMYLKDISTAYGSGAMFVVDGIKHEPYSDITMTVSKSKITFKIHDVLMLNPDFIDEVKWNEEHTVYGQLIIKPKDPYTRFLGCKGGNNIIKNGGFYEEDLENSESWSFKQDIKLKKICSGIATSTCSHSSRRIPVSLGGKRYNDKKKKVEDVAGGSSEAAADGLSPYRFDHNHTIVYNINDMAKQNHMTSEQLVRRILESDIGFIVAGNNLAMKYLSDVEICYLKRFLWNLYGYSESKLKVAIEQEQKKAEQIANQEKLERQQQLEKRRIILKEKLNSVTKEGSQIRKEMSSDPSAAYNMCLKLENICNDIYKEAHALNDKENANNIKYTYIQLLQLRGECNYEKLSKNIISKADFDAEYKFISERVPDYILGQLNYNYGVYCTRDKKHEEAVIFFNVAIEYYQKEDQLKKDLYKLLSNQAYCYGRMEDENNALKTIQKAIELEPEEFFPYDIKGVILLSLKQQKQASKYWDKEFVPKFGEKAKSGKFYGYMKNVGLLNE